MKVRLGKMVVRDMSNKDPESGLRVGMAESYRVATTRKGMQLTN